MKKNTSIPDGSVWVIEEPVALAALLKPLSLIAKPSAFLPVLENIEFDGKRARACNGEVWISTEVVSAFPFAVSAKMFMSVLNAAGKNPVTVRSVQNAVEITFARSRYTIPVDVAGGIPELPDTGDEPFATINFGDNMKRLLALIGENDMHPLNSRLHIEHGFMYAVNKSQSMLARLPLDGANEKRFGLPLDSAAVLAQFVSGDVVLTASEKPFRATFTSGKYLFVTNLMEPVQSKLTTHFDYIVSHDDKGNPVAGAVCAVNYYDIAACAQRMLDMQKITEPPHVNIKISEGVMRFAYAGDFTSGTEECDCSCDHDVELSLNIEDFLKIIKAYAPEEGNTVNLTLGYRALQYDGRADLSYISIPQKG
jgi:hypothetical protein